MAEAPTTAAESGTDETKSLSERIHAVRADLVDIQAIIDLARGAIDSGTDWSVHRALEAMVERLGGACIDLQLVALDARKLQEVRRVPRHEAP